MNSFNEKNNEKLFHVSKLKSDTSGYLENSLEIKTIPEKMYSVTTEFVGIKGKQYCAYFGVVFLENDKEIDRKIQWLNDFSGQRKKVSIVFKGMGKIKLIYRINSETPAKFDCNIYLLPINMIKISESANSEEIFDMITNYPVARSKELTEQEESTLEKNLVWVFGSPRSGTMWLASELLSYQTISISEPRLVDHLSARVHGVTTDIIRWRDRRRWHPSYFFSDAHKETWKFYLRKLILNRIFSQVRSLSKKIIIQSALMFGGADFISECLPNSKIIILLRDGRDVIDSLLDAREKGGFMTRMTGSLVVSSDDRISFIEFRSKIWVKVIENLLLTSKIHPKNLLLKVRYENLLRNTLDQLDRIYRFLEIDISQAQLEKILEKYTYENIADHLKGKNRKIRFAKPGKWKEDFNENEKKLMEKIMGKTLLKIGYER